jgi:hypothetical protein
VKLLPLLLVCGMFGAAQAAPVDDYAVSRDRAIAALADSSQPNYDAKEKAALAKLEIQLKAIIGLVAPVGFSPSAGRINLETLSPEVGFGQLDGLVFTKKDPATKVVVTTDVLLRKWIAAYNAGDSGHSSPIPADFAKALISENFFTFAVSSDTAVAIFAVLPVQAPAGEIAHALLIQHRQDIALSEPDEIAVTVVRGGKVFAAIQLVKGKIAPVPACDAVWRTYEAKHDTSLAAYRASGLKDENLFAQATKFEEQGDAGYRECFAARFKDQAAFAATVRQAEALRETLEVGK